MKLRSSWLPAFMSVMLVVLSGCGGASSKAPDAAKEAPAAASVQTPTPAAAAPAPEVKRLSAAIAPGPWGGVLWLPEMVGEGLGAFNDQGVDLKVLKTNGGNDASKALMSGEADFALLAFDHVLKNRAQGADLVVVAFLNQNPGLIMIVQPELQGKVTSIKDLKGQKVGVSSLGGGTHSTVLSLMKQAGMNPNDIEFVAAKDKLVAMWDQKQIAAAMHVDPQISELTATDKAWILYDYRKSKDTLALYGTGYPLGTLVTRQDVIDKNPELVQRVVKSILAGSDFIKQNPASAIAGKVPDTYREGYDPKLYEIMVKENIETLSLTGIVPAESMETVLRELKEKQVIPSDSKVDVASSINLKFIRS